MNTTKTLLLLASGMSAAMAEVAAATTAAAPAVAAVVQAGPAEAYSTSNRVGCAANLNGYHFNLKELSLPIDE